MSFDIYLNDPNTGTVIVFDKPHQFKGGTHVQGGTKEAWLNITYNYSKFYYNALDKEQGIRKLNGMTAKDSIPLLVGACLALDDNTSDDYWEATEGNAKQALIYLLAMAKIRPDGIWEVS